MFQRKNVASLLHDLLGVQQQHNKHIGFLSDIKKMMPALLLVQHDNYGVHQIDFT